MFKDETTITVISGNGGDGLVGFRREKYVPHGGPAGGDGGKGGDVLLVVDRHLNTLASFIHKSLFKAPHGRPGGNFHKTGAGGHDVRVKVPPGTLVYDAEFGDLLGDLTEIGQTLVVARGGRGGRGNARFKSSTNQAPRMAERGEPGIERRLKLELKLIADVGIVGVPNAGKSTLLSVISDARPRIAAYPFTTLEPNLGVVMLDDREIVFADIPGLIEGAHLGIGLGHSFLKHIQRTRILVHLVDASSSDPLADYRQINTELGLFDPGLLKKPQIVVLNKIDLPDSLTHMPAIKAAADEDGHRSFAISGVTRMHVSELIGMVLQMLDELPPPAPIVEEPVFSIDPEAPVFEITVDDGVYVVSGERIERAAAMTYWEHDEAVQRFQRILEALGVTQALEAAGCGPGDTVRIGKYELEWFE